MKRQSTFIYATPLEVVNAAKDIMESMMEKRDVVLTSPQLVRQYLSARIGQAEHEIFCVLFLDNQHRLITAEDMFRGTIDGASVYPREVVKAALRLNSAAVIFSHNHPSGELEPSQADRKITERLKDALELVDVRVLDHLIVSGAHSLSFAERGML